jgi:hypothetical protein
MRKFIQILLVLLILNFSIGFYLKSIDYEKAPLVIGVGVLVFAFVLLPSFLYHRYHNKNLKDYTLDKDKINQIFNNLRDL